MQRNQTLPRAAAAPPMQMPGGPRAPLSEKSEAPIRTRLDEALGYLSDAEGAVSSLRYALVGVEAPTELPATPESIEAKVCNLTMRIASLLGDIRTIQGAVG